jgi:hypothetical protein
MQDHNVNLVDPNDVFEPSNGGEDSAKTEAKEARNGESGLPQGTFHNDLWVVSLKSSKSVPCIESFIELISRG